jgi:hypothetical protein
MKLRHLVAAIAGSVALVMSAVPAEADVDAFVVVVNGTATLTAGTDPAGFTTPVCAVPGPLPAVCPAVNNTWTIDPGTTAVGVHAVAAPPVPPKVDVYAVDLPDPLAPTVNTFNPAAVSGTGTVTGWCGSSNGNGSVTIAGETDKIVWTSVGGTIILTGGNVLAGGTDHDVVVAVVQARPVPTGPNCVTGKATNFLVVGVAVGAHAP